MSAPVDSLVHRLHAKRSGEHWMAKCPAHDDREPSLSISEGADGRALLKCWAGCELDAICTALECETRDLFPKCTKSARSKGFNWQRCVAAFKSEDLVRLGNQRWYSRAFCSWLHGKKLVGQYDDGFAFPVGHNGTAASTHYRVQDGSWRYHPPGVKTEPFIIGDLSVAKQVHAFESQFDAFALADRSDLYRDPNVAFVATRGAGNARLIRGLLREGAEFYVWPQNDLPGLKWLEDVYAVVPGARQVVTPSKFKDANDWTSARPGDGGAFKADLLRAIEEANGVVNSSNSYVPVRDGVIIDDFPEPLSDVAFEGLAGDIVRRIEPHTEADPVALLTQVLIAFGSVIGRNAFITADGSRHAMNLFAVLVGESSKSRKGTSLAHVRRVFACADEGWEKNCTANGLSSGEGLIWAVRDAITKTVPKKERGKFTGEHETVIADAGIDDKRLIVVESEFANVLKVISREGNTLSPVIRSAWDSGDLRSMTKNSEARAIGAHVSIVGHITRDENRRLLTETESANGFGNRFLWVAVKRSKCLPEGGNMGSENFNNLVVRLHDTIEFARYAGEVKRSEDARELWRIVYPALSEGKPGLLGAITARAEAQVMRLSAIYALLDCSTTIEVEHHRAALALWNYCDRSARWIFQTATGDSRADRILLALQAAGRTSMTRTEISERVFNRNLPADSLDAALRILHQSGHATFNKETTRGPPRSKWFAVHHPLRIKRINEYQ